MAKQVQIAHTVEDELQAVAVLTKGTSLLCLPRVLTSSQPKPVALGTCDDGSQIVFLENASAEVFRRIIRAADGSGRFHVFPKDGVCVEWDRTQCRDGDYTPGRYFFTAEKTVSSRLLEKAFDQLATWIKKTHPLRSDGRFPIFVGPALAQLVSDGKGRVAYANGRQVELAEAPTKGSGAARRRR